MKYGKYVLIVLMLALFVPAAFSQESPMTLDHKEFGKHERPGVVFSHDSHEKIQCMQCHHDFDQFGNNTGGEDKAQPCSTCHAVKPVTGKNPVALVDAFHGQCKGCHEAMNAEGMKGGPVMCGECHVLK